MGDTTLAYQFPQLPHSSIQVHDFFNDIGWNIDRFIQIIPLTMAEQIRSIPITPHVDDQIVWIDTSDGRFVTKSAWQLVRAYTSGCGDPETDRESYGVETSFISPSGRSRDSSIASRLGDSRRYSYGAEEDHLESLPHHLASAYRPLISAHPLAWRHGHRSAFWCHYYHPLPSSSHFSFWRTPPVGSYKINTDGCVKDGVASGGGIIRDSSGQCIRAFFSFYGECTILEAELRAILDGIILAQRLGLSVLYPVLWVESDSTLAIHCITKGGGPWHIQATLRHIRHLLALDRDTITHIFREGNQVADLIASEGWDRSYYYEYSSQDLPRRHRSLVQIDRFGLPTVRGL
ncbi:Uncharacterized protein Adt_27746 [Abeliophyllum distichum]|uniref:RNase H type-1 domain-containing protein n=1 Tax=Abeliophyllum distichum TaxID=126358 RepID=A0ABD1RUY7_9LAMI